MGIPVHRRRVHADLGQHLRHLVPALLVRDVGVVDHQTLLDDLRHRQSWAQRTERVLKHDLHFLAQRPDFLEPQPLQFLSLVLDRSGRSHQPQNCQPQRRLAGPALADDPQRVALVQREINAVNGADVVNRAPEQSGLDRKVNPQVRCLQQHRRAGRRRVPAAARFGADQQLRILVLRRGEYLVRWPLFDEPAFVHHIDAVGQLADDAQFVGDDQHRHAQPLLQILQQVQNLRLDGHVDCRRRLVGDQQFRLVRQRHRDHHALSLSAGQLVRKRIQALFRLLDADHRQQFQHPRPRLFAVHVAMQKQRLGHLPLHGMQRVQRRHRFLKDHRNPVAANVPQQGFRRSDHFLSTHPDRTRRMERLRIRQQLQDR